MGGRKGRRAGGERGHGMEGKARDCSPIHAASHASLPPLSNSLDDRRVLCGYPQAHLKQGREGREGRKEGGRERTEGRTSLKRSSAMASVVLDAVTGPSRERWREGGKRHLLLLPFLL